MTTPAFRSLAQDAGGFATVGPVTINKPTGTASGDYLLAFIHSGNNNSVATPSGWTLLQNQLDSGSLRRLHVYGRQADGSEPASWSWTHDDTIGHWGFVAAYQAGGETVTLDTSAIAADSSSDTSFDAPTVTATRSGLLVTCHLAGGQGGTMTAPSGMTEDFDSSASGTQKGSLNSVAIAAGATGTKTATSSTSAISIGFSAVLLGVEAVHATATPAVVSRTFVAPALTTQQGSAPTPAVTARSFVTPAASKTAGSTLTPAAIVRAFATPAATVQAGTVRTPAVLPATTAAPASTFTSLATQVATVIARSFLAPAATIQAGSVKAPAVLTAITALPASTFTSPATVTGVVIARVLLLPAASSTAESNVIAVVLARSFTLPAIVIEITPQLHQTLRMGVPA